jgi:hypothetical protein
MNDDRTLIETSFVVVVVCGGGGSGGGGGATNDDPPIGESPCCDVETNDECWFVESSGCGGGGDDSLLTLAESSRCTCGGGTKEGESKGDVVSTPVGDVLVEAVFAFLVFFLDVRPNPKVKRVPGFGLLFVVFGGIVWYHTSPNLCKVRVSSSPFGQMCSIDIGRWTRTMDGSSTHSGCLFGARSRKKKWRPKISKSKIVVPGTVVCTERFSGIHEFRDLLVTEKWSHAPLSI